MLSKIKVGNLNRISGSIFPEKGNPKYYHYKSDERACEGDNNNWQRLLFANFVHLEKLWKNTK